MNSEVRKLVGKQVSVQSSGKNSYNGILTDIGNDILVLFNGLQLLYIPMLHVHRIQLNINTEEHVNLPIEIELKDEQEHITFKKALSNAKGIFIELSVKGTLTFHGSITNVLSDYLTFYSPIYKLMLIPLDHIKWLIPYQQNHTPYSLSNESLAVSPSNHLPILEDQLKKEEGRLVVLDGGMDALKMGLLKKVENDIVELVVANGETVFIRLNHVKAVQLA